MVECVVVCVWLFVCVWFVCVVVRVLSGCAVVWLCVCVCVCVIGYVFV